jgi:predicted CopG family antitoxin
MATKTISIDTDAYDRLRAVRKDSESFSQTIKRLIRPQAAEFERMLRETAKHPLSDDAIAAVEQVVAQRRKPARRASSGRGERRGAA